MSAKKPIILASKSPSRAMILSGAGVSFDIVPAHIDESKIKIAGLKKSLTPLQIGAALAKEKALRISRENPLAIILGADQILELEGEIFDKPKTITEARQTLRRLSGKTHKLIACVALAEGGEIIHELQEEANLTMLDFSDEFLDDYLNEAGPDILTSVGAYQLEGLGAKLFAAVEGDFFTVLGLPLTKTLEALQKAGALAE